jgi:CheY-like chemotaxis protein
MDINMKNMDGCSSAKILRENGYNGYIIATTGNILAKKENYSGEINNKYKYENFNDIIIKPYSDIEIKAIIFRYY